MQGNQTRGSAPGAENDSHQRIPRRRRRTMLRKISTIAAMTLVLASAACNSITAPVDNGTTGGSDRPDRYPDQVDKVCIDDLRAVDITSPGESQQIVAGQL